MDALATSDKIPIKTFGGDQMRPNEILLNLVFIKKLEIPCEKGNCPQAPLSFVHVVRKDRYKNVLEPDLHSM